MRDPSVKFPKTYRDVKGVERVAEFAAPNYVPAATGLTERQEANAARREPLPAESTPIVPTVHPSRPATV